MFSIDEANPECREFQEFIGIYQSFVREDRDFQYEDAQRAVQMMLHEMEHSVFIPTLLDLRQREEDYLYAMAHDEGYSSTSEVAKRLGISMTNASNLRRRLVEQGIIKDIRMGVVDFNIPLLKDYLRSKL